MRQSDDVKHTVGSVEIESLWQFDQMLSRSHEMNNWFVQGLDLRDRTDVLLTATPQGAVFLGCQMTGTAEKSLRKHGALVFPKITGLPFDPYRASLYTAAELYGTGSGSGQYADSPDALSNAWRLAQGNPPNIGATLAMSLHDHAIGDALMDAVDQIDRSQLVGIMGGHKVVRGSAAYSDAAMLGLALTQSGKTVLTGGGPGAMEAVNLGARMVSSPGDLDNVVASITSVPCFQPDIDAWSRVALEVCQQYPTGGGYGIPTWFYGHEPPNVFASKIAKYFSNAIREDVLLKLCSGGVLYLPGAAGTVQEVFQAATPAYYSPAGAHVPPLVLVGHDYWTQTLPVWPLLCALAKSREMSRTIFCVDTWDEALDIIT